MELFKIADVHFTRDSSSVYEANYVGVPSFVYGEGVKMYRSEVELSLVFLLEDFDEYIDTTYQENDTIVNEQFKVICNNYKLNKTKAMISEVDIVTTFSSLLD